MQPDRYTKAMLTIIAVCLMWLSLGGASLIPTAHAQRPQRDSLVYLSGWIDADDKVHRLGPEVKAGLPRVDYDYVGPLPVSVGR